MRSHEITRERTAGFTSPTLFPSGSLSRWSPAFSLRPVPGGWTSVGCVSGLGTDVKRGSLATRPAGGLVLAARPGSTATKPYESPRSAPALTGSFKEKSRTKKESFYFWRDRDEMEAPQLLKSRNKGSIQVRDEAAVRFVNADPTGALCHVGSRDLGGSSAGWAGGGVAGRPPGPSRARGALCALRPVSLHLSPSAFRIRHMSPCAHLPRAARRVGRRPLLSLMASPRARPCPALCTC